jgi:hypothetical protein
VTPAFFSVSPELFWVESVHIADSNCTVMTSTHFSGYRVYQDLGRPFGLVTNQDLIHCQAE